MRLFVAVLLAGGCALAQAAGLPEGRWQGSIAIPERELVLVVDLGADATGRWSGSLIVPGLGVAGAPLRGLVVTPAAVEFDVGGPFAGTAPGALARVALRVEGTTLRGELRQAGHAAPVTLRRTGPARVEPPPRSTAVEAGLADRWVGDYELGGYPRRVTIVLANRERDGATAQWTIVGKQRTELPVERVVQDGRFVRIESPALGAAFEGRFDAGRDEIEGAVEFGAVELPIVLRRAKEGA